jgi:hypothetical protein
MQCAYTSWGPISYPPKLKVSSSQSTFSISQTQTHFEKRPGEDTTDVQLPLPSHVKSITSTSNPFVKHCLKLRHSSSYRHSQGSALVVGATPIRCHANPSLFDFYLSGLYVVINQATQNSNGYLLFCFSSSVLVAENM